MKKRQRGANRPFRNSEVLKLDRFERSSLEGDLINRGFQAIEIRRRSNLDPPRSSLAAASELRPGRVN